MASLQNNKPNNSLQSDDDTNIIHILDITNGSFPEQLPDHIESSDTIEFKTNNNDEYDVFQVYKDGTDYYRINNGLKLLNISNNTPENKRQVLLSFAFNPPKMELYFCIIPSTQRGTFLKSRKCLKKNCEKNCLILHKSGTKFSFNDNKESQKVILHKGDTIELEWTSKRGHSYRIEENKYCPISGGLYKIEQTLDIPTNHAVSKGKFTKTFNEFGTSFLFRLTETNQIHDIIVCIIKEKYQIKHIEITDTDIQPNIISIEQNDSILFEWHTQEKQTIVQIDPFLMDNETQQSIESKTEGEHFSWPNDPTYRGCMIHKFNQTGIFCFKTANNQIGTIIVQPEVNIHSFPVFGEQLILKMNTNDLIEFEWKMTDSEDEPILITIDANSSVVPDAAGGLTGIFDCSMHKCVKVEPFFRHYFHTCETFLLHIPQHGLYSFAYSDNRDDVVLNVIVERSINNHHVAYNEQNMFEPNTIIVNRYDQVWFDSISTASANIYRTDEYGNHLEDNQPLFQPQLNSINYFMQQFRQIGIYYFSTDINNEQNPSTSSPLAIIVLPEIRFHYKLIRLGDFDSQAIITNINDFIIWQFEQIIRFGVIQLRSNETLQDLASCHDRAVSGRNRQCLAVECIMPGAFYFANPEFERVTGSEQDRLISTIIIDPPFSQACFLTTDRQFVPDVLYIAQNETVSWIVLDNDQYHRIYIESIGDKREMNDNNRIDRSIKQLIDDVHYLYTFNQCGQFTIRSDRFKDTATVIVYPDNIIRSEKKRVPEPQITEEIDTLSQFRTQVHLKCSNRQEIIFYTLDGTLPTRHYDNVHIYNSKEAICFDQSGFHILRAYATDNENLSSDVITSSPTYVMENAEVDTVDVLRSMWNNTKITLSASIYYPNKLYGKIQVEPSGSIDLVDHFELYVDDVAQSLNLLPSDVKFSAEGFAGGEQYEIYILAYPKQTMVDTTPIPSNKRVFEIKREIHGAPLISLAVSSEQSIIFLMWAHIGDHINEYVVYVDNIETTTIFEKDFNDFFGIQFHGTQPRKRYLLHVEAKIKNSNDIRKSNIIAVNPPLEMPLKEQLIDRYFAYITVNAETPPPDMRLEIIHLDHFPHRRPEPKRKVESVPITKGLRNSIPTISFKQNSNGITLFWTKMFQPISDFVESYQIIVDGEQYGELMAPHNESKLQLNLPPGKHECYISVIMKDKDQEICQSNILKFDIPSTFGVKSEQNQIKDASHSSSKLWIENISGLSVVVCWSPIDGLSSTNTLPDYYKLYLWNSKEQTQDQATVISISNDKTSQQLKDLQSATTYEIQLEACKRRRDQKTEETYVVSATSDVVTFTTGSPPDAPSNIYIISSTNTAIHLGFDPFIEHNTEIIALHIHCEPVSPGKHPRDILLDLTPDSTECLLANLIERTDYNVTIYAITGEYLNEIRCRDVSQLPKELKSSDWLTSTSLQFTTSGCEPVSQIHIRSATIESIQLEWVLPKAYGSTQFLGQILRWKLEQSGEEHSIELDCNVTNTTIPGILQLGLYRIALDSLFSVKVNLEDETNRKEVRLTTIETTSVRYRIPGLCERPEIYLTGYTTTTIDLTWNKPNIFSTIDHPERLNEQIKIHRRLLGYRVEINGRKYNTLNEDQYQCTLTECQAGEDYKVQLVAQTTIQNEYINDKFLNDEEPDETPSKKLHVRMLTNQDLLRSFQANFEFHHHVTKLNTIEQRNEVKPLGKINVHWTIMNTEDISHIILQWHSSKDLRIQQKIFKSTETSFTIDACDEKDYYIIEIIIVTNDNIKHQYEQLKMPIPGEPDAPKLWLVKTSDSNFVVEWSEPKSYGIPVIGFQLYIEGKKVGDMTEINLRRAEIPSNINRTYEVNVCALTNNPQRTRSVMSQTLSVITAPTNDRNITHMIPLQIESMNEEKLHLDWTSFLPMIEIRSYYIHYTCLNNGQVQTMKVSKRHRHAILRNLKPGFTYGIMVLAVDKDGEILYTSDKTTIQMSAPPNAPIVAIRERTIDHVTIEWRPVPSFGELAIVGYKIFINNRLTAIVSHDQLTYTLTNGSACEEYTIYVQALSNDKTMSSPMSRGVTFTWPGIKPGAFRRLDNGQTGTVVVAWEHPHLEDDTDKLIGFKLISENTSTHAVRLHGEFNADTYQAAIYDLINGKYRLWLEIQSEHYSARARPITIISNRFRNLQSFTPAKCFMKKQKRRFRSPATSTIGSSFRQIQYS